MRNLVLTSLILAAAAAAPAGAEPYGGAPPAKVAAVKLPVGQMGLISVNPTRAAFFLDLENQVRDGDKIEVTILYVYAKPYVNLGRRVTLALARERIDCTAGTHQMLSRQGFDDNGELQFWSSQEEPPEPNAGSASIRPAAKVVCDGATTPIMVTGYKEAAKLGAEKLAEADDPEKS